jgi:hypothetical protein
MVVVLGIALPFLVTVHMAWQDNEGRSTAFDGARAAAVFIGKGIRNGHRFSNVPSPSDTQGSLQFDTLASDGTPLQRNYYFDTTGAPPGLGWVRLLETDLTTGESTDARLAGPVQSLSFDVRQADGVTPASHAWEAQFVRVSAVGATGETGDTFPIVASALKRGQPAPCALFCGGNLSLSGSTGVTGDVYAGGDLTIGNHASVTGGLAYAAGVVIGNGGVAGPSPTPPPALPTLDHTYYDDLIATANNGAKSDFDATSGQLLLNGATRYFHGYVKLRGTAEVVGPGTLVLTHDFRVSDLARVRDGAHIIVGRTAVVTDSGQMVGGGLLYSVDPLTVEIAASIEADVVTPTDLTIDVGTSVSGIVYAGGGARIQGSLTGAAYFGWDNLIDDATVQADPAVMHHTVPGLGRLY